MTQITQTISNHPILNKPRAIRVKEISYINFDIFEAKVEWEELFLDSEGNPIIDDTVANRLIHSHICNSNKVTAEGILIDSINFPKEETESEEDYQNRFNTLLENGIPEFDFYIQAILNMNAIKQGILTLDKLGRLNRR